MNKLTEQVAQFLDTPDEQRDWNTAALLLLQLTNNTIMYRNISLNPKGKAEFIEGKLRQHLKARRDIEAHDEVNALQQQVDSIIESRTEFTDKSTNPATDFKAGKIRANESQDELAQSRPSAAEFRAGKRADHDSLPEDIQALYVENLDIVHRMRELHLRLRLLSEDTQLHTDAERKPLLDEFISLDKKLHANWDTYDHFVTKEESEEKADNKESEISPSSMDQLPEQPNDSSPNAPSTPKKKSSKKSTKSVSAPSVPSDLPK